MEALDSPRRGWGQYSKVSNFLFFDSLRTGDTDMDEFSRTGTDKVIILLNFETLKNLLVGDERKMGDRGC